MLSELLPYTLRVLPGLLLLAAAFWLARRVPEPLLRIVILILGFVLIRDAMTPVGFWHFGTTGGAPWLRFTDDPAVLVLFAAGTLLLTAGLLALAPDLRRLVRWGRPDPVTILLGIGGGLAVAAPALLLAVWTPVGQRGGAVAVGLLPVLLLFTLAGNLAEEVLFRGFLQGRLAQLVSVTRAALLSAVLFAGCHIFLSATVTDVGWLLLLFTLYEGLICAFLRAHRGVLPAALAHGLGIFLLASGLP